MLDESAALTEKLLKLSTFGGLAGFGGAVKYVSAVIKKPERISHRRFLLLLFANIFISSFCGLMGGLLVGALKLDVAWQYIGSGIFGYAGTHGLDLVMLALKRKIEPSAVIPIPPTQ